MSYITAIGTANPENILSQSAIAEFMVRVMQLDQVNSRKLRAIFKSSGIETRHSVLDDYGKTEGFHFYSNSADFEPFPSTEKRQATFRQHALGLSLQAIENLRDRHSFFDPRQITHLILVCCTGMYAPGLDIELVQKLNIPGTVQRTCITFMGCYAAFNALKAADAFCKTDSTGKVLIVCTELCSLHFQKKTSDDNLLANALFADGSAALLVEAIPSSAKRLRLAAFHNDLAPEGSNDMAWTIGDLGFEMKLSSYVPEIIKGGIKKLTDSLLLKIDKQISDIRYFAIHPGGKKILEAIEEQLRIGKNQNQAAYDVLRNFGNMSSPTVLFVLQKIFQGLTTDDHNEHILSFAFGPGLTLESMLLEIEMH
ncbi:MAG TPA: type III polyketide synthase [Ohtaekwangia sp.]